MKKALQICAVVLAVTLIGFVGVTTSRAQTTNVLDEEDIAIKGKLAPDGTAVTGESLSGNTNNVAVLRLEIVAGGVTNHAVVIGQVSGSNVVSLLEVTGEVDVTPTATKGDKSVAIFEGSAGSATNAVLVLNITDRFKGTNTTAAVKFQGIWNADDAVSGTMASVKVK